MDWMQQLKDLEKNEERNYEQLDPNYANDSQSVQEENDLYTYSRYKTTLQALKELESIGEDVSQALEFLEETWSKSECNPINIQQRLKKGLEHISVEDYYKEVQASLLDMEADGHDVAQQLRLLEENRARIGLDEGLEMEKILEELERKIELLNEKSFSEGEKTQDEK